MPCGSPRERESVLCASLGEGSLLWNTRFGLSSLPTAMARSVRFLLERPCAAFDVGDAIVAASWLYVASGVGPTPNTCAMRNANKGATTRRLRPSLHLWPCAICSQLYFACESPEALVLQFGSTLKPNALNSQVALVRRAAGASGPSG